MKADDRAIEKGGGTLFFPYYVNQPRLLDIYAILNGGFTEYEEIQGRESNQSKARGEAAAGFGGFRFLKFGVSASLEGEGSLAAERAASARKVQTVTSVLDLVIESLGERGYLHEILEARDGDFVVVPVSLKINSINALIGEVTDLAALMEKIPTSKGEGPKARNPFDVKTLKGIASLTHELFGAEEFVSETADYAVIGSVADAHLYQANRRDIVDARLTCLGQVRRVHPDGTGLMRNTVFSKINNDAGKKSLVDGLSALTEGGIYSFDSVVLTEIRGKPVYELEVIALYQEARRSGAAGECHR